MLAPLKRSELYRYVARRGSVEIFHGERSADSDTWQDGKWALAVEAAVEHFSLGGSPYRPITTARLLHDHAFLYLRFDVSDRYVLARARANQDEVYRDSCVEFFVQPPASRGYFNFEFNCGGTIMASFIEDPSRVDGRFKQFTLVDPNLLNQITIAHSLPKRIDPELPGPIDWKLCSRIPFAVLEHYVEPLNRQSDVPWRCNFYKCAEANSHPHWASWAPLGGKLDFHQPERFGELWFEK